MYRFLLCLCLVACAPKNTPSGPVYPESQRPEAVALREDPDKEYGVEWSEPIEAGNTATRSGIVLSEGLAERYARVYIEYPKLRVDFIQDRKVFGAQRVVYENLVEQYRKKVEDLRPSWWTQNKFYVGIGAGLFLGVASAVMLER